MHYLNMKMKVKLVEIMDLQLCSALKLDGVQKKGTSWAGPRLKIQYFPTEKMWCDVFNKPKQGAYFRLDRSHLQNVPVEYNNEVEHKRTHNLSLPKDEQDSLEKSNKSKHMHSLQECVGGWYLRISEFLRVRDCKFQEKIE